MAISRLIISALSFFFVAELALAEDMMLQPGSSAPDFTLQDLDKLPIQLKTYLGRKVILHFWAPSCFVCPQEVEALDRMQKRFGNENSQVVTVVSFDNSKKSLQSISEMNVELPIAIDSQNLAADMFGVKVLPETLLINEQGKFVEISDPENPQKESFRLVGPRDWGSQSALQSLRKAGFINGTCPGERDTLFH